MKIVIDRPVTARLQSINVIPEFKLSQYILDTNRIILFVNNPDNVNVDGKVIGNVMFSDETKNTEEWTGYTVTMPLINREIDADGYAVRIYE